MDSKPQRRWNPLSPRIPTFWFCVTVAFCLLSMVPVWRRKVAVNHSGGVADMRLIVANAYLPESNLPWKETLVIHTVAATLLGAAATIALHLKSRNHRVARTFGIKSILILTFVCGLAAAILRNVEVHSVVIGCALVPIVVYPFICFIAVKICPYEDDEIEKSAVL
jgi:hypothetical protein